MEESSPRIRCELITKKGSVYIDGVKVAGCGGQPERGEVRVADYGRIDAEAVCAHTKETT